MLRLLDRALDAMDQPTSDGINTFIVADAARQSGIRVVLSGLGVDELFGGSPLFADIPQLLRMRTLIGALGRPLAHALGPVSSMSRRAAKVIDLFAAPSTVVASYLARRKIFTSSQLSRLMPRVSRIWHSGQPDESSESLAALVRGRPLQDAIGLLEMRLYMSQTLLRDSDVMGMSHSVEIRVPFLDADFAAMALSLDKTVRLPIPRPKWVFTDALQGDLPIENVHRKKQGFALPFQSWMLGDLRGRVEAGIERLVETGIVDGGEAWRLWRRFEANPDQVGWYRPWTLFVLGTFLAAHTLS